MNTNLLLQRVAGKLVATGVFVLVMTAIVSAQVTTQQSVERGPATQSVTVERGEVAWVSGNDVMVKMESGELRHFPNIPESARVTVGARQLSVHELQPGMKLERTTITSSTPRLVTTVRSVAGTVWTVTPPTSVILTMENGVNQRFTIPKDQKFMVEGRQVDAFGLRKGMKVSASAVTESLETGETRTREVSGRMPPPPTPPPARVTVLIVEPDPPANVSVASAAARPAPAPQELPRTGSQIPLVGLLGLLSCAASVGIRMLRRP